VEEESRSGIIMTVFSTASAVGKTLLSINMAAELAKNGYKVCVADLDLQFGDVCNYLHLSPQKTIYDAQQAAENKVKEMDVSEYMTPYEARGTAFSVLAAPLKMEEAYNISTQAVLTILLGIRGQYDYVVLDTAATFSDLNLAVMDLSTMITFVGIVDFIPTIKNMKVGYDTMRSIGYEKNKIRFVLNRSNSKTHIELQDVEQLLAERFYHVLPNDFPTAIGSIHQGIPLVIGEERSALSKGVQELIAKYTNRTLERSTVKNTSVASWVKRLFN
jgi:pilus assembly protein CpaE